MMCKLHIPWVQDLRTGIVSCECGLAIFDPFTGACRWRTREELEQARHEPRGGECGQRPEAKQ